MRHQKKGRKFGRKRGQRKSFIKGLAENFILNESITTTDARAKELRPFVEKQITLAKKQNLASLRLLIARLSKKSALKLFYDLAPKYKNRGGGYTRITKISNRRMGDNSKLSVIEFL